MANPHLERLVRRIADDPFFLAPFLTCFAASEHLDDGALAVHLGCSIDSLTMLRLCRNPSPQPPQFFDAIQRIAENIGCQADALAAAVRRGHSLLAVRPTSSETTSDAGGFLMAARDADDPPPEDQP